MEQLILDFLDGLPKILYPFDFCCCEQSCSS